MNLGLYIARLFVHPEKADPGRRRIACIGDSITFGAGVAATRKTDAWTYILQNRLGDSFQVLNYGVSGATLQREGDFPYRRIGFLKRLKKAQPELIVLMLGTNDSKPYNWNAERFGREYEALVRELIAMPWPHRLVLMTPPEAFPEEKTGVIGYDIQNEPIRDVIRPLVFSLGQSYELQVIDLYALTEEHPEYFCDGVHPNELGNRILAEQLVKELALG